MHKNVMTLSCSVVVATLLMGPAASTRALAPGESPAAGGEAARPAGDPAAEAVRATRTFVRTLVNSDYEAAYELTAPPYREATTPEAFAERMAALRESAELYAVPQVRGWVLMKPPEGEPRRAMLAVSAVRGAGPRRLPLPTAVGIELHERDGRWLVAEVRELVFGPLIVDGVVRSRPGPGRPTPPFSPGQEADDYAAPIRAFPTRDGTARRVSSQVGGTLTEVREGSVTIRIKPPKGDPAAAPTERTFKIDERTVVVARPAREPERRNGFQVVTPYEPASTADLRVGLKGFIEPGEDDEHAATIGVNLAKD